LREIIASSWAVRARSEREAEERFRGLARSLASIGAHEHVVALAVRASLDEQRHAVLCARIARFYGASVAHLPRPRTQIDTSGLDAEDATLAELVSLACVGETLSVAALGASLEVVRAPDIQQVLRSILRDEAAHAKFGWQNLTEARRLGRGDFLHDRLSHVLEASLPDDLFDVSLDVDVDEAARFGELCASHRAAIYRMTFDDVIFPWFERLGVDTGGARNWVGEHHPCATE
jgi:hypothetical protein